MCSLHNFATNPCDHLYDPSHGYQPFISTKTLKSRTNKAVNIESTVHLREGYLKQQV